MKFLLIIILIFNCHFIMAGQKVGNGGDAVVCFQNQNLFEKVNAILIKNSSLPIERQIDPFSVVDFKKDQFSVETFDLYYAKQLGFNPVNNLEESEIIDQLLERLLEINTISNELSHLRNYDLKFSSWLPTTSGLIEIPDSNHATFLPRNCLITQAARNEFINDIPQITYDTRLYKKMSSFSKAILQIHEYLYVYLLKTINIKDSKMVRKIIADVLTNQIDREELYQLLKKTGQKCVVQRTLNNQTFDFFGDCSRTNRISFFTPLKYAEYASEFTNHESFDVSRVQLNPLERKDKIYSLKLEGFTREDLEFGKSTFTFNRASIEIFFEKKSDEIYSFNCDKCYIKLNSNTYLTATKSQDGNPFKVHKSGGNSSGQIHINVGAFGMESYVGPNSVDNFKISEGVKSGWTGLNGHIGQFNEEDFILTFRGEHIFNADWEGKTYEGIYQLTIGKNGKVTNIWSKKVKSENKISRFLDFFQR